MPTLSRFSRLSLFSRLCCAASLFCTSFALAASNSSDNNDNSHSASPRLSATNAQCMTQSEGVTAKMLDCMGAETQSQDQQLNAAYKKLIAGLVPARQQALKNTQRAWLKYRELNCGFYADPDGGSMARIQANDCFLQMTAARAQELQELLPQQ